MISSAFALVACLGISLVPIFLMRRGAYARAREYFVASERTPFGVVRNSSIAYSLQIAGFGLFFWYRLVRDDHRGLLAGPPDRADTVHS